jgi:hypothetical protein
MTLWTNSATRGEWLALGFPRDRLGRVMACPATDDGDQYRALVADRDGVIRRWDSECVGVLGYSSEDAVGQSPDLIVPPALQARHWRGFNSAVASGH